MCRAKMSGPVKKIAVRPTSRADVHSTRRSTVPRARTRTPGVLPSNRPTDRSPFSHTNVHQQGEAAKASGLLGNLAKVLPWKITGPASGAEWKEVPIGATEYRVTAPA